MMRRPPFIRNYGERHFALSSTVHRAKSKVSIATETSVEAEPLVTFLLATEH